MTSEVDRFILWASDIERTLWNRRDELMENLSSADEEAAKSAISEIEKIDNWLNPSPAPVAAEEKLRHIRAVLEDKSVPPEKRLEGIRRLSRSTGLPRGRPRDKTGQYAMRALTLSQATDKSWRQITLEVKGCPHRHPKGLSCEKCKETIRNAVFRLQKFLRDIGCNPKLPGQKALKRMSKAQLDQLWHTVVNSHE